MGVFRKKKPALPVPARRRTAELERRANEEPTRTASVRASQFRRGRTLPGTTSARLQASEARAVKTATPREKLHHLAYVRRRIAGAFGIVLACVTVLLIVLWQFTASVVLQTTAAYSVPQADLDDYAKTIQRYFADNPTERLRINLRQMQLNEFVARHHPEVLSIAQQGSAGFTKTAFLVQLRKPVVSWRVDAAQYFVDAHGVSFTKNAFAAPSVTIVDSSGVRHTPGTAIASARFLGFVGQAVALAQQNKLSVQQVTIPAGTSRQVELSTKDASYPFILSIDRSPGEQIEDVLRVRAHFHKTGATPRYVDVRVKGKAFYRE